MPGPRVDAVCFFGGFEPGYPRSEVLRRGLEKHGVRLHMCRTSPRRRGLVRAAILAWRYLAMKRPFPIVYVPEFRHKDVPLAYVLARATGKRLVFDPLVSRFDTKILDRGDAGEGSVQAWHNRNLDRISLRLPDVVLADTRAHAEYYADEFGVTAERIKLLPVGFDEDLFDVRRGAARDEDNDDAFKVLFFGNYLPLHGADVIVSAAEMLRDVRDIRFELIGDGQTFAAVTEFARAHKLESVRFLPRIPIEELPDAIACADVCLGVFGRTEKASRVVANKVFQSMAMGRAVVTADSPAIREFFVDSKHLCLVPPGHPGALAEKVRYLYEHPVVRQEIGQEAARYVREHFTSVALAKSFIDYCKELLKPGVG